MFYKNIRLLFIGLIFSPFFQANAYNYEPMIIDMPLRIENTKGKFSYAEDLSNQRFTKNAYCGPMIGDIVPCFTAESTQGIINFPQDFAGKWIILFSHPADFTPVCTTEFKKMAMINEDLKALNCQLVGLSVDSSYTHKVWLQSMGLWGGNPNSSRKVDFPIIGDIGGRIARLYGMIHPNESTIQTVRSIYFIDPSYKLRAIFHYPSATGRNFNEMKRLLIALQTTDRDHVATPANWKPGDKTISKEEVLKDVMPD